MTVEYKGPSPQQAPEDSSGLRVAPWFTLSYHSSVSSLSSQLEGAARPGLGPRARALQRRSIFQGIG